METRFYENPFPDLNPETGPLVDQSQQLLPIIKEEINEILEKLWPMQAKLPTNNGHKSDTSIYTGHAGHAFLNLFFAEKNNDEDYVEKAMQILEKQNILRLNVRDITFLCGALGPLCVSAVLFKKRGEQERAAQCMDKVLKLLNDVVSADVKMYNELLYGRIGYLHGLLYLQKYFTIPDSSLRLVADKVIEEGRSKNRDYLMWNWKGKEYLGAAHGVAGIVYVLLQVGGEVKPEHQRLLENTVNHLISISFPSGNLPSSIGSESDKLVHWCHGAPGFVHTLLAAYNVWKKSEYLRAAEKCGDVVWERGLLKRGYGICHGIAGNAYTFIALYQVTGNEKHLHRALQFARWCAGFDEMQERLPDRPLSLYEGIYGVLYFLKDIQDPIQAVFPCYSFKPYTKSA